MIRIGFVGDFVPGGIWANEGGFNDDVKSLFSQFDLRVANLESALYNGKSECKIKMNDPKLGNLVFSPEECIRHLLNLNINVVSLANNHVFDCDFDGFEKTIELLDSHGIAHFGAGRTENESKKPAVLQVCGKTVCLLGYFPPNWEAPYPPRGDVGGLNPMEVSNVIQEIRLNKKRYDYVFVMPHWGKEHTVFPLIENVAQMKAMILAGADGIMGAHSHKIQPAFVSKNCAVAMSMGNFVFPDRYIVPPRKTYYPTSEELRQKNVPVTQEFPIVSELTYVKGGKSWRTGLVCEVILDGSAVSLKKHYTEMTGNHLLRLKNISVLQEIELYILSLLFVGKQFIGYKIFCKVVNKLAKILNAKKRFGYFDVR